MLDNADHPDAADGAVAIYAMAGQPPFHQAIPPIEAPLIRSPSVEPTDARAALLARANGTHEPWWIQLFAWMGR